MTVVGVARRRLLTVGLAASLTLMVSAVAFAAGTSIHVRPHRVEAGKRVHIKGSADGCGRGSQVTLLSRAFSYRHDFASVSAVFTHVRRGGKFERRARIPARRAPGRYAVRLRCAGGNLDATAHLRVLAP